jgi:nucleoside-diphosphate-sugar epimerase
MVRVADTADFTVFGATGFIGRSLTRHLKSLGHTCFEPARGDKAAFERPLGHVIYCIGLTADWRARPLDVVEAHVTFLEQVLRRAQFSSLLYLSSTRIYKRCASGSEDAAIPVLTSDPDDLFDASKLLGETMCLSDSRPTRVARLSNVYGPDFRSENFLSSIIRDALKGRIVLRTALESAKDYVSIDQVTPLLVQIATGGRRRLYNVASGLDTSHGTIVRELVKCTGCGVDVVPNAPRTGFPRIDISRITDEFEFSPRELAGDVARLVDAFGRNSLEAS